MKLTIEIIDIHNIRIVEQDTGDNRYRDCPIYNSKEFVILQRSFPEFRCPNSDDSRYRLYIRGDCRGNWHDDIDVGNNLALVCKYCAQAFDDFKIVSKGKVKLCGR